MKQIEQHKIETMLSEFAKLYNQSKENEMCADRLASQYINRNSEPHFKSHFASYYYWQKRENK